MHLIEWVTLRKFHLNTLNIHVPVIHELWLEQKRKQKSMSTCQVQIHFAPGVRGVLKEFLGGDVPLGPWNPEPNRTSSSEFCYPILD